MRNNIETNEENKKEKRNQDKHAYNEDNYQIVRNMQLHFPWRSNHKSWFDLKDLCITSLSAHFIWKLNEKEYKEKAPL